MSDPDLSPFTDGFGRSITPSMREDGFVDYPVLGADAVDDGLIAFTVTFPPDVERSRVLYTINALQPAWWSPPPASDAPPP